MKVNVLYPTRIKLSNTGDILINIMLIRELSKHSNVYFDGKLSIDVKEAIEINNPYVNNFIYPKMLFGNYSNFPVIRWFNFNLKIIKIQYVFDVPGHLIVSDSPMSILKSIKDLLRASILRILGIKLYKIGVTLDIHGSFSILLQRYLSRFYCKIGVRDDKNFELLQKNEFKNICLINDLALLFCIDDFKLKDFEYRNPNAIIISFRGSTFEKQYDNEYFSKIKEYLFRNLNKPEFIDKNLIFCYQVEEDIEVINDLYILFHKTHKCQIINNRLSFKSAILLYQKTSFILTNRLHVAILGILCGSTSYIISDVKLHSKVINVFEKLDFKNLVFNIDNREIDINENVNQDKIIQYRIEIQKFIKELF